VLIPCHNEEQSVSSVVSGFRQALPEATIYVCDNQSTDSTSERAIEAGAIVLREPRRGKGNAVRRMFADIDADVYVMVDGDGTYHAPSARMMVDLLINNNLDMVVGSRCPVEGVDGVYRRGHTFGNALFTKACRLLFQGDFSDVFSGFRIMSRRFIRSFPGHSSGFEIETELSSHAIEVAAAFMEVPTPYGSRQGGSESKLRTYRDGLRIVRTAVRLFKEMRPLQFFGVLCVLLTAIALALGIPVVKEYVQTGLVLRFPTAILAAAIQTVAFICLTCGLVLETVGRARREARRLVYLQIGPPRASQN
jgi:glycosyltransferase involved in cell wall biosynthesis